MDGVSAGAFGDVENLGDVEIRFIGGCCADRIGLVRFANVQRAAVNVGVDDDCGNPHFVTRADDAHCNFASVGYEDFLEHFRERRRQAGEPKILQQIQPGGVLSRVPETLLLRLARKAHREWGSIAG